MVDRLLDALQETGALDGNLFAMGEHGLIHESSICFRVAHRLAQIIEADGDPLRVDREYNRRLGHHKTFGDPGPNAPKKALDLIVHCRHTMTNRLAVEFKKGASAADRKAHDLGLLELLRTHDDYSYDRVAFVEIVPGLVPTVDTHHRRERAHFRIHVDRDGLASRAHELGHEIADLAAAVQSGVLRSDGWHHDA